MAMFFRYLLKSFSPPDNPDLLKAQYKAFSRQVPLLYIILVMNCWALSITHFPYAPVWLTLYIAATLSLICIFRIVSWWKQRDKEPEVADARAALQRTLYLAVVLSLAFSTWSLTLYGYGTPYTKAHVGFFMAITIVSCVFCLMHLRSAAIIVGLIVNTLFVSFFMSTGEPTFIASGLNVVLVTIAMLIIVSINYNNFKEMVETKTRALALSKENFRLANLDSLTDLPNRRAFFSRLERTFEISAADNETFAVGVVDLDGFKPVNDTYGHAIGDKLLREIGTRLRNICSRKAAFVARLGGDEFAFLIEKKTSPEALLEFGKELCDLLAKPVALASTRVQVSGSIGFAIGSPEVPSPTELMNRADYALYHSKRHHRGAATVFSKAHSAMIHRESLVEQMLRGADLDQELRVAFQPIIDIRTDKAVGFEALARWNNPTIGPVSPAEFIPIAERAGIISRLTGTLLQQALSAAATWPDDLRLSFNLSAHDLALPENLMQVAGILRRSGFDPRRLDMEITETTFAFDPQQVQNSVNFLREIGCGVALDDFGTGYSSLSRLHALPLTKLKIDRSFVMNIEHNPASCDIVRSLVNLSRDRQLDCIVEGVETLQELAVLRQLDVNLVQGFLYSPPMEADQVPAYIAKGPQGPAVHRTHNDAQENDGQPAAAGHTLR